MRIKFYLIILTFLFILYSCGKVKCDQVLYKDGFSYYKGKKYTGECFSYHQTGVLSTRQFYKNGLDHGDWNFYHKNSKLETSSHFNMGKRIGEWKYYYIDGSIKQLSFYTDGGEKTGTWLVFNQQGDTIKKINHN